VRKAGTAPYRRGPEGAAPWCEQGKPRIPKKEGVIPINPRGEPECSFWSGTKIEHCGLKFHPFTAAFSGIDRGSHFSGARIFLYFISKFFMVTFRTGQKGRTPSRARAGGTQWEPSERGFPLSTGPHHRGD
jgi:hypothetical protein